MNTYQFLVTLDTDAPLRLTQGIMTSNLLMIDKIRVANVYVQPVADVPVWDKLISTVVAGGRAVKVTS